jgi:hypothetical protein
MTRLCQFDAGEGVGRFRKDLVQRNMPLLCDERDTPLRAVVTTSRPTMTQSKYTKMLIVRGCGAEAFKRQKRSSSMIFQCVDDPTSAHVNKEAASRRYDRQVVFWKHY